MSTQDNREPPDTITLKFCPKCGWRDWGYASYHPSDCGGDIRYLSYGLSGSSTEGQVTVARESLDWIYGFLANIGPRKGSILEGHMESLRAALASTEEGGKHE